MVKNPDYAPSKVARNLFESMDLTNGLSSLWVGHGPMGTQNPLAAAHYFALGGNRRRKLVLRPGFATLKKPDPASAW